MYPSVWLTIDIGNSAIKAVLFSGNEILHSVSTPSIEEASHSFEIWNSQTPFARIGLCSVVPQESNLIISGLRSFSQAPVFEVDINAILPIQINYTPKETLGPDRIAAACAAWSDGKAGQIIVDAGSAITVDVVSTEGIFLGGVIMSGPTVSSRALVDYTAKLPNIPLVIPNGVLGDSTVTALQHGLIYGMIDAINGAIDRLQSIFDHPPTIQLTGGWHSLLAERIPGAQVNKHLVLEGIKLLMLSN